MAASGSVRGGSTNRPSRIPTINLLRAIAWSGGTSTSGSEVLARTALGGAGIVFCSERVAANTPA
jgi:hypothetical protein